MRYIKKTCDWQETTKRGELQSEIVQRNRDDVIAKMNFFYAILISQFLFARAHPSNTVPDALLVLPEVKIALQISPDHNVHLHMKLMDRVLANKHLPVWVLKGETNVEFAKENSGCELKLEHEVMRQLGGFSFYQDPETNSAAVYYHRRREFDGMIDTRYLIQRLSIDKIHASAKTKIRLGESDIIHRPQSIGHPPQNPVIDEDSGTDEYTDEIMKTYGNRLYSGYPEILVIISCDFAQELFQDKNHPDTYTSIITYVLTLFNGVDMIYSKLKKTNVQLNIAGIIIAADCQKISFMDDCYDQSDYEDENHLNMLMDGGCVMREMQSYLYDCRLEIPFDSYDVTVFLTRNRLYHVQNEKKFRVEGISLNRGIYEQKKSYHIPGLVAAIQDDKYFNSYAVVAHELAHLMNVPHDKPSFVQEGECCGNIMQVIGTYWCKECLSWSDTSEQAFKTFFSSADCCGFTNKPRSLYEPGRRVMLTADEQCQCYGYKSTIAFPGTTNEYCVSSLLCEDENAGVHQTVIPLDGTPCSYNKVCWNYVCIEFEDSKVCKIKI